MRYKEINYFELNIYRVTLYEATQNDFKWENIKNNLLWVFCLFDLIKKGRTVHSRVMPETMLV